jgi:hypothetical protein
MFILHLCDAAFSTLENFLNEESASLINNWLLFSAHAKTLPELQKHRPGTAKPKFKVEDCF